MSTRTTSNGLVPVAATFLAMVAGLAIGALSAESQGPPVVGKEPQAVRDAFLPEPPGVTVEPWAENLDIPWSLVFLPDGRALVSERTGRIFVVEGGKVAATPYARLDASTGGEGGLMGLALHPGFPAEPYVYVMYTYSDGSGRYNRVARLRHNGDTGQLDKVIIDRIPAGRFHDGGRIAFGPDGMFYVCTGETGQPELAQDKNALAGKILRVTPDGGIPQGNPFPGSPVWTYGHRNPQGLAWHPLTGVLYASEHGPSGEYGLTGRDEINVIEKGRNYGWPRVVCAAGLAGYVDPIVCWTTATPPSGIAFRGNDLFVATLRSEALVRISFASDNPRVPARIERWFANSDFAGLYGRLRDVVPGPDGRLYVLTSNRDGRGDVRPGDDKILRITLAK